LLVVAIVRRESSAGASTVGAEEESVSGGEAIRMLRDSKHLQVIAIVIACAAMGAAIIEQQLNMAAESRLGPGQTDSITAFLAQPASIKYRAKPFVDVTMDRFAKAMGALLILVLIKPWGLHLDWQRLSLASLTLMAVWVFMALRARREYLAGFRRSIEHREV